MRILLTVDQVCEGIAKYLLDEEGFSVKVEAIRKHKEDEYLVTVTKK